MPGVAAAWLTLILASTTPSADSKETIAENLLAEQAKLARDRDLAEKHLELLRRVVEAVIASVDVVGGDLEALLEELSRGETEGSEEALQLVKDTAEERGGNWMAAAGRAAARLGDLFFLSDYRKSGDYYSEAVAFDESDSVSWKQLGVIRIWLGDLEGASEALLSGLVAAGDEPSDIRCRLLINLVRVWLGLGDAGQASQVGQEALRCSMAIEQDELIALSSANLATIEMIQGRPARARELAEQALSHARAARNKKAQAAAFNILGSLELSAKRIEEGVALLTQALKLAKQAGVPDTVLDASLQLAAAKALDGRLSDALELVKEALETAHLVGSEDKVAQLLMRRCELTLMLEDDSSALPICRESLEVAPSFGPMLVAFAQVNLGMAEARYGSLEAASELCSDPPQLLAESMPVIQISALGCRAVISIKTGKLGRARQQCEEALAMARSLGVEGVLTETDACREILAD